MKSISFKIVLINGYPHCGDYVFDYRYVQV